MTDETSTPADAGESVVPNDAIPKRDTPPTPNLDKMVAVKEKSELLSRFVDFLDGEDYAICANTDDEYGYTPIYGTQVARLFAEFFEIDYDEAERERQRLLEWIRE